MRVPTGDEVNAIYLRRYLAIADATLPGLWIVAQVGHPNYQGATLLSAQNLYHAAGHADRIKIGYPFEVFRRDQIGWTDSHAKQTNADSPQHTHHIRLDPFLQRCA